MRVSAIVSQLEGRWLAQCEEVDRSGVPLTFTTPAELRCLRVPGDLSPWNRAVLAFLLALPQDARVVLYWC